MIICGRCHRIMQSDAEAEHCWYCDDGRLCHDCWDRCGHCGHPEADALGVQSLLMSPDQRLQMVMALHPDMEPLRSIPKLPQS
jgi:hypothetical protein